MNPSPLLDWRGQTAVILASGPSLPSTLPKPEVLARARTITTNTSWQAYPQADVYYACDHLWWKHHFKFITHKDRCWTQDRQSAERYPIKWVRQEARDGLGQTAIRVNGNSGFGAINLAYLFGARRILLLGFDMQEVGGAKHWHPDHPAPLVQRLLFREWLHKSTILARELREAGCEVVNCTPGSALTVFRSSAIEKELL